jgi:hypothetical protein
MILCVFVEYSTNTDKVNDEIAALNSLNLINRGITHAFVRTKIWGTPLLLHMSFLSPSFINNSIAYRLAKGIAAVENTDEDKMKLLL